MNLFENILNKAKTWVNYLATGKAWSDLYDWANPEQQDPIQRFFDDPAQDMSKKQALMDNLKSGVPVDVMKSYVTEKYYKPVEFKQTVPTVSPTFQYTGKESPIMWALKTVWNIPSNLYNIGATTANLASTAYQEWIPETAWMIARWAVKQIWQWAQNVATSYQNQWLLGATNTVLEWANKFLMENPLDVVGTPAVWSLAKQWVKATGKTLVKWVDVVSPVAKTIIKKPVQIIKNKATDIFGKELRAVEDIAGNILQPYKWMVENLDDATNWLRRVVEETWTSTDTFQWLLWKIDESLTKYGKMKQESLWQITQTKKSVSAQKALENLENVYDGVSSKEMLATQSRVRQLAKKNMQEWLTPLEMDEVKILHTKANNLFNEKWQTTGWFSSDDLRGIRKDLKNEIEDFAEANGVTNIREINKAYWEIADAKTLAQNQVDNLKAYKWRQIPATRVQKIADFIMEFPVIKQAFSDPARILASSLFKTLRWDKINPIEVQKRLPSFLKELKEAWMRSWDLQKIEKMIQNEVKLLPAPSGKPISANVVNLKPSTWTPRSDAMVGKQGNIPWTSKKETIIKPEFRTPQSPRIVKNIKEETRPNPNVLAKNKWVIVWEQKLLPAPKNLKNDNSNNNLTTPSNNSKKVIKKPIIKPKNESKVIKPTSSDTIPEGYFKNAFWEIQPLPSNKKGGFVKIPEIWKNPIVNKQTWETLNQAIEKLRKNNWSEKDIQKYKDNVLGKKESFVKKEWILDTVNPTGWLFVDYTPSKRANSIISSKELTTLDKTLWKSPDDYITIYRGTVKWQKEMNPWDFVTDLPELAKSYAGWDKIVISKRVKYSDIIDSINEGWWNEYLYIPKEMQKWDNQPKPISPQKTVKPLTEWKQSATMGDMETKKLATPEELLSKFTGRDKPEVNLSNLKKASPDGFSLEKVSIDKLKHNIRIDDFENPTESIWKIKWIIEQYKKDWKLKPIILDKNGNVLDWNHRVNAYKALWIKEIPVYFPVLWDIKKIDNLATRLLKQNQSLDSYFSDSSILKNLQ